LRNIRLRSSILFDDISEIGKIKTVERQVNLNADKKRFWIGRLTDVRKKETNYSTSFSFPEFDPDKI